MSKVLLTAILCGATAAIVATLVVRSLGVESAGAIGGAVGGAVGGVVGSRRKRG